MLKEIQIVGSKNRALKDSRWLLNNETQKVICLAGYKTKYLNKELNFKELGLVEFEFVS